MNKLLVSISIALHVLGYGWLVLAAAMFGMFKHHDLPEGHFVVLAEHLSGTDRSRLLLDYSGQFTVEYGKYNGGPIWTTAVQCTVYASLGTDRIGREGRWLQVASASTDELAPNGKPIRDYLYTDIHWSVPAALGVLLIGVAMVPPSGRKVILRYYEHCAYPLTRLGRQSRRRGFDIAP